MKDLIYLAAPYSSHDPNVMEERFRTISRIAAVLLNNGHHIFSPISHTHPIAIHGKLQTGWDFWREYDEAILKRCNALWLLQLPQWERSKGVRAELIIAHNEWIPCYFLSETQCNFLLNGHQVCPQHFPATSIVQQTAVERQLDTTQHNKTK